MRARGQRLGRRRRRGLLGERRDGNPPTLLQSNRPGGPGSSDIYVSAQAADGSWGPAVLVPELSSLLCDSSPNVRFDGLELFLVSHRPGGVGLTDVWVSTRETTVDPWSAPVNLGPTVNGPFNDQQAFIVSDRQTLSSRPTLRVGSETSTST